MIQGAVATLHLNDDDCTLAHVLARRLVESGDRPWVLTDVGTFTYRDIDCLACRLANSLTGLGVARGDTVLLMLNNSVEFVGLWCALSKIGADK